MRKGSRPYEGRDPFLAEAMTNRNLTFEASLFPQRGTSSRHRGANVFAEIQENMDRNGIRDAFRVCRPFVVSAYKKTDTDE